MALLPYQDALDLKRTAERVNEVDEKEKQAKKIIKDERKILKNAEQEGRERVQNRMREVERELEKKKEEMGISTDPFFAYKKPCPCSTAYSSRRRKKYRQPRNDVEEV